MFILRTLHVYNLDRVVVRLQVLVSLEFWNGILVHRVDEDGEHCLSSVCFFHRIFQIEGMESSKLVNPMWSSSFAHPLSEDIPCVENSAVPHLPFVLV